MELKSIIFVWFNCKLYSYNLFFLYKKYDIFFELEFEKSIYFNEYLFLFEIWIEFLENRFVFGVVDVENYIFIVMFYGNFILIFEWILYSLSYGLKKFYFFIEVNYEFCIIKFDIFYLVEN